MRFMNFIHLLKPHLRLTFAFWLTTLLIKAFQHIYIFSSNDLKLRLIHQIILNSVLFDFLFCFLLGLISTPLFLLFTRFRKKAGIFFSTTVFSAVLIINLSLTGYLFSTLTLLDSSIFSFSLDELLYILSAELSLSSFSTYLKIICVPACVFIFISIAKKIKLESKTSQYVLTSLCIVSLISFFHNYRSPKEFSEKLEHDLTNNNIVFLFKDYKTRQHLNAQIGDPNKVKKAIHYFQKSYSHKNFISLKYPMLSEHKYPNTLKPFFGNLKTSPNIVFVFCESLSRSFSGPNTRFGSFTPFLDSLKNHSLYFENFLSNADRTFGVFPNVISSLPNTGKKGVINNIESYPRHESLISRLKDNYESHFYFGGWKHYDQMFKYFRLLGVDKYISEDDFDKTKYSREVNWAYSDKDLFSRSLTVDKKAPYLNFFMTTSLHTPWKIPSAESDYYNKKYASIINESSFKKDWWHEAYHKHFKCALYSDDAVKSFISKYKKRPEFKNTIFIIVGDHNIRAMKPLNPLEFYHVPLIIYSPLLKKAQSVKSINSHRDITPSLLRLLEGANLISTSKASSWFGEGLTMDTNFNCLKTNMFSTLSGENMFMKKDLLYANEKTYKIHEGLLLTETKQFNLKEAYEKMTLFSKWVIEQNRIKKP